MAEGSAETRRPRNLFSFSRALRWLRGPEIVKPYTLQLCNPLKSRSNRQVKDYSDHEVPNGLSQRFHNGSRTDRHIPLRFVKLPTSSVQISSYRAKDALQASRVEVCFAPTGGRLNLMPSVGAGPRTVFACAPLLTARTTLDPVIGVVQVMARLRFAARGHALPIRPDFRMEARNERREAWLDDRLHRHRSSQHDRIGPVVPSPCGMVDSVA